MNKNIFVKRLVFVIAVILTATLVSGSRVTAHEAAGASGEANSVETVQAVEGGPGYVSISGAAFAPENNNVNYSRGSASVYSMDGGEAVFYAPVTIPDGATINQLVLYYYDTSTTLDVSVDFYKYDFSMNSIDYLVFASSSGSSGYSTAVQSLNYEVSNERYAYILKAEFPASAGSDVKLLGVRIDYGFPTYVPLINK